MRALQLAGLDERRAGARDRVHRALWRVIPYLQRGGKNARRNHLIAVDLCALPGEKTANGGLLQAAAVRACCSCPSSGSRPTGASSAGLQRRIGSNKKGEELQGECAPVATAATAPSPRWLAGLRITKCRKHPAEAIESTSLKHASINILKGYGAPCLQTKSPLLRARNKWLWRHDTLTVSGLLEGLDLLLAAGQALGERRGLVEHCRVAGRHSLQMSRQASY